MKLCLLLVFATLIGFISGMPPISRYYNTHCHCPQVESRIIPPTSLKSIKIIHQDHRCPVTEVIAGLVSGEHVCLNPQSPWVKKLVTYMLQRQPKQDALKPKSIN